MNKSVFSISVLNILLLIIIFQSCRKQAIRPTDPCRKPQTVVAVEKDFYYWGHFKMNNPGIGEVFIYAMNWNQYADKVKPGRYYKLGYKEVSCEKREGSNINGIRIGGCIIDPGKCIVILCLEEIEQVCFETVLSPPDSDNVYSLATNSTGIKGNSLNATVMYSGCSTLDVINFNLYAEQLHDVYMKPAGCNVWTVKAVNVNRQITCQAVFEKEICFDVSAIKNYYLMKNTNPPDQVIIRLMTGSEYKEFSYKF